MNCTKTVNVNLTTNIDRKHFYSIISHVKAQWKHLEENF